MTDIDLVKSKIDIVEFISQYLPLKKAGRHFKALCPFHSEKTPSFIVSPERQSWYCFGACAQGGDVISFLQKWEGIEFYEALKSLAQRVGVRLTKVILSDKERLREKIFEINHLVSEFYHYLLTSHRLGKKAIDYLTERKIKKETIKTFTLGYAPQSWESLFSYLKKKGYEPADIDRAGLLVRSPKGTYYDRFRGRLIFPIRDTRGNVLGFSGRLLEGNAKQAKYINTSETLVYTKGDTLYGLDVTKESIKKENKAVLVEGEFDLLSSFQNGVPNVVAIKGSALTEGQIFLLKRFAENFILALDSDPAGNEAVKRGIEKAEDSGVIIQVVRLPFGKDPADCIAKNPKLWIDSVQKAVPVYDFIIDNAFAKYEKEGVIGKRKIGNEVVPFLSKIKNPIILSHYLKILAKKLEVSEESIENAIESYSKKETLKSIIQKPAKRSREEILEEHLLALVIQCEDPGEVWEEAKKTLELDDFYSPSIKKIFFLITSYLSDKKKFIIKEFTKTLSPELIPGFDRAYLSDLEKILTNKKLLEKEIKTTVWEIKRLSLRRKIVDLSTKIRQKEDSGQEDDVEILRNQLKSLFSQIRELEKKLK